MTPRRTTILIAFASLLVIAGVALMALGIAREALAQADDAKPDAIDGPFDLSVGRLMFAVGDGETKVCFSDHFLTELREATGVRADPKLHAVTLDAAALRTHPMIIWTGEGDFELTDDQRKVLRAYVADGGVIIASAGCSSRPWGEALRREAKTIWPDEDLRELAADHAVCDVVYEIGKSRYRRAAPHRPDLFALEIDGRPALIFSPDGLNDTDAIGGECCCCGGDEVKKAPQVLVNVITWVLTQ